MDNEEIAGVKFSEFPMATPGDSDEVVGLHAGDNARFSVANFVLAIRQGLANIFVPKSDVGAANGVASLDSTGKVPSEQLPPIASTAADVTYDNTQSGLTAEDVQEAIDELAAGAGGGGVDPETIAPVEESTTATVAHPLGSIFYLNDILYRALANIAVGGTINTAAGGNATQTTVAQNFKRTVTLTSAEYAQLSAAEKAADIVYIVTDDNAVAAEDVSYDPTTSGLTATDVQAAIDEVVDDLGNKQDTITASGILKGDGAGGVSAATAGTDYQAPLTAGTDYATPAQLEGKANQSQLAYVESGTTASRNYTAGQYIFLNGLLYTADTAIASGATFYTSGGNKNLTECVGGGFNSLSNVTNANVTFSNNITGYTYPDEYHLCKSGNIVVTSIYMYAATGIAGMGTLLCTVPEAFRPSVNRRIATWLTYNNETKVETVAVKPDGEVVTASGGYRVSGWIRVFGTYML